MYQFSRQSNLVYLPERWQLHFRLVERLSPDYLFDDQLVGPSSPLYWVLAAALLLISAAGLYAYLQADRRFAHDRMHRRLAHRFAGLVAGFSGLGLAATIFALLAVPFLSKRLWLALSLAGLVGTAAYGAFYARRRYPAARFAYLERERRERSLPRHRTAGPRRRARRRS